MTTTEQIQELQQEVTALQDRMSTAESNINTANYNINHNNNTLSGEISDLEDNVEEEIADLHEEDVELHREIHVVANNLTQTNQTVNDFIFNQTAVNEDLEELEDTVAENKQYQDEENVEIHREIHNLGNSVDNRFATANETIFNITRRVNQMPTTVILSETEYENLPAVQQGVVYYVYEED